MRALMPTFAVLRPDEWEGVLRYLPEVAARYETVTHIRAEKAINLQRWGLAYWVIDTDFVIWKLRQSP